jgi:DNA replication protein DnaC
MAELITERIRRNAAELRLRGIAESPDELIDRAEAAKLGYREFLDLVLESELGVLEGRRYASRLKSAALPHHKTLEEFDASFQPELDGKRLAELRSLRFIERKASCLILGPPGVGKSHISVGLAMEALAAIRSATRRSMTSFAACASARCSANSRASSPSWRARTCW